MIRLGIFGKNYGAKVLAPAFAMDPRCKVVGVWGSDAVIHQALDQVDAVAIAVPPAVQPTMAMIALARGIPVFAEKPFGSEWAARCMLEAAAGRVTGVDFNLTEVPSFRKAKELIAGGAIGALRHVTATWHVENEATRKKLDHWKTRDCHGGGVLGNFASHSLHYLEWFCGQIIQLSGRLAQAPDLPNLDTTVTAECRFAGGASGALVVSCAAFLGSGHRIEFYGTDGAMVLENVSYDTMRGFTVRHGNRDSNYRWFEPIEPDPLDTQADGRIAPVARLASKFLDRIEGQTNDAPDFAAGYRVQTLIEQIRHNRP
jgi:predicted dehydrogenase